MDEDLKKEENSVKSAMNYDDDACSICLDAFCQTNPSTATNCKHEFHLKCILEWCERSSCCPMCSQLISLKDLPSQELFKKVERWRRLGFTPSKESTRILPLGANDPDPDPEHESRATQHLAAAPAVRNHLFDQGQARIQPSPSVDMANANKQWSSILKPTQKSKVPPPSCSAPSPKKQKIEKGKTQASEPAEEDAGLSTEAMKMLPSYIATVANTLNESVGNREAESMLKKSDGEVLQLSVSHLMRATVLMVEHSNRMDDLNGESRKTREELESTRTEITVLRMEMEKKRKQLDSTKNEMTVLRRDKANAVKRANRAYQRKLELQTELKKMKGLGAEVEKLKADVASKEAEAVAAVESFKKSKEFEVLKKNYIRQGMTDYYMESKQKAKELEAARVEIAELRREKAIAVETASQVEQKMIKMKADLENLEGVGAEIEKLKADVAAKEAEAAMESFKKSNEIKVLKQDYAREKGTVSFLIRRGAEDRAKAKAEIADLRKEKTDAMDKAGQVEQEMVKLKGELKKLWQQ